ncbi:MAG: hypothetical protein K6C30_07420 [Bacteroidaceae bacterium]|nr:hypothetical protein [Bacteroidaceae bacterium]
MSKTIETQIEKSRGLIAGLRKHVSQRGELGVTTAEINKMEALLNQLKESNLEVDRLREELTPKVRHMNQILTEVKASYAETKKVLKGYYSMEQWAEYGVPDKR